MTDTKYVAALCASCSIALVGTPTAAETPPVNALWNTHSGFGVWIYPTEGSCPEIRTRVKSFLVVGPDSELKSGESKQLDVSSLQLCSNWAGGRPHSICESGALKLEYFEAEHEYRGSYDVKLSDGSKMQGVFRAQYCKFGY